jgi:hypothetical protein
LGAKLRIEREAAKVRRQGQEKQQQAERAAMQAQDKLCYQTGGSAPPTGAGTTSKPNKRIRPLSGKPALPTMLPVSSAGGEGAADWGVVTENGATGIASTGAEGTPMPTTKASVKLKPKPVVDQIAVDAEYYQKALPPKRPHVPRLGNAENSTVNKAKQKLLEVIYILIETLV